jgi:anaerobic glycerol-3-phosphate dehydrogenase
VATRVVKVYERRAIACDPLIQFGVENDSTLHESEAAATAEKLAGTAALIAAHPLRAL